MSALLRQCAPCQTNARKPFNLSALVTTETEEKAMAAAAMVRVAVVVWTCLLVLLVGLIWWSKRG